MGVNNGVVTLDLHQVLTTVSGRLGLPGTVVSKLPPSAGNLTLFKSSKLSLVDDVGNAIRHLALAFSILIPVLWALTMFLAKGRRRRTLMSIGFSMVIAGLLWVAGRHILQSAIANTLVSDESGRRAVRATIAIGTSILAEIAIAFVFVGVIAVVCAWFAGPARIAVSGRRAISPFLRERAGWTYAIVALVLVLFFIWQPIHAAGTPVGILVFAGLALLGTEVLRRQTEFEFPDSRTGDASAGIRQRVDAFREHRRAGAAPTDGQSLPQQLERLATLRDDGAITPDEYDTAKSSLLHV